MAKLSIPNKWLTLNHNRQKDSTTCNFLRILFLIDNININIILNKIKSALVMDIFIFFAYESLTYTY